MIRSRIEELTSNFDKNLLVVGDVMLDRFVWGSVERFSPESAACPVLDFEREKKFYAKKYGWTVRYRKSGRTLCSFFPEAGAFSVLIVLGGKESAKVEAIKERLNTNLFQLPIYELPGSARKLILLRYVAKIDKPQTHPGKERLAAVKPSVERLFR